LSKSKIPYKSISIEQHVNEIIDALNYFQNISNNKIQKNLIESVKKELVNFVEYCK
jgi:hypothetical protein